MNIKSGKNTFHLESNSVYIYRGFSNSLINFKTSIDYFSENKLQVRLDNGITSAINVYEYVGMMVLNYLFNPKILVIIRIY